MTDCSNTPTPESTANFDLDSRCFSEVMTSNADYTATRASDGNVKKTFAAALRETGQEHVGEWSTNPLVVSSNQVIPYAGTNQLFRPLSLPYQVDSAANPDPNVLLPNPATSYAGELVDASQFATLADTNGTNLLSNHNFLIPSPDDSQPAPDSTPRSYPPGYEVFAGVFANETTGVSSLTYIDGRVSFSGGDLNFEVPNTGGLEYVTDFVASVADFDGKPRTRGVSFALVGSIYRVKVGVDALTDTDGNDTLLGSVKFEQGKVATGHEVNALSVNNNEYVYATDHGFIVNDPTKATTNAEAIVKASALAFSIGSEVRLPYGKKYIDDVVLPNPVTISANTTRFGASLSDRLQNADVIHTGSGYAFGFIPRIRPTDSESTEPVTDGPMLKGLSIRGTPTGKGAWRVNDGSVVGNESYARRNFTAVNCQISGYHSGYGYRLYWTFTNTLTNVTVWDCAVPYYLSYSHATSHHGCVYEQCSWGTIAIDTFQDNHYGTTIEGIRPIPSHNAPSDYDVNGGYLNASDYAGWASRVRGGTTNYFGGYVEANIKHYHPELNSVINCFGVDAIQVPSVTTENIAFGDSGVFTFKYGRIHGATTGELFAKGSVGICTRAEITDNSYIDGAIIPASKPTIATVGTFDVKNNDVSDPNGFKRLSAGSSSSFSPNQFNSGNPVKIEFESIVTTLINLTNSGVSRSINLSTVSPVATRMLYAFQYGSSTIAFTQSDTSNIKNGEELTIIVDSDACTVSFDTSVFSAKSPTETFSTNKSIVYKFVGLNSKWLQVGTHSVVNR